MTRISKQEERRMRCPYKRKAPAEKTGPKKDNLPKGYREHSNSLAGTAMAEAAYLPPIKTVS